MLRITVNGVPPSNNKYIGNGGKARNFKYQQEKSEWHWRVKAAIKKRPDRPLSGVVIIITYHFGDRRRHDPDNYSGKFILDALVKENIIQDDSFGEVNELCIRCGGIDRDNPRTIIEIREQ